MPYHTYENPLFGRTCFLLAHIAYPFGMYELYKLGFAQGFIVFIVALTYDIMGGFGITCGAHRLWSHKSYKANNVFKTILMLLNTIAFQGEIYYWVRDHRVHHKYSDTLADPHDYSRGFWFSHFGWLWKERTQECKEALYSVPMKDIKNDKVVMFQMKYYIYLAVTLRIIIPFLIGYFMTNNIYVGLYFNVCVMWCHSLHHTFLVNSASHKPEWGKRPYDPDIYPGDNILTIILALGEGHHNFHHSFPFDYSSSEVGWKNTFNPSKWFIDFAAKQGWVTQRLRWKLKPNSPNKLKENFKKHIINGYNKLNNDP